eukprot:2998318-Prymnesium_polylepis.2
MPSNDLPPFSEDDRLKGDAVHKLFGAFFFEFADWRPTLGPAGFVHEHERSIGVKRVEDFALTSLAAKV